MRTRLDLLVFTRGSHATPLSSLLFTLRTAVKPMTYVKSSSVGAVCLLEQILDCEAVVSHDACMNDCVHVAAVLLHSFIQFIATSHTPA